MPVQSHQGHMVCNQQCEDWALGLSDPGVLLSYLRTAQHLLDGFLTNSPAALWLEPESQPGESKYRIFSLGGLFWTDNPGASHIYGPSQGKIFLPTSLPSSEDPATQLTGPGMALSQGQWP